MQSAVGSLRLSSLGSLRLGSLRLGSLRLGSLATANLPCGSRENARKLAVKRRTRPEVHDAPLGPGLLVEELAVYICGHLGAEQ